MKTSVINWIFRPAGSITILAAGILLLLLPQELRMYTIPAGALLFGTATAGIILRNIPVGDAVTVYLASMPLLVISLAIMGWLWFAEPSGDAGTSELIQERGLLLSRGMIKDAMYTIHLHAAENHLRSGGEYAIIYKNIAPGYSIINSRFETPYNNAGVDIYLEYAGRDSIVLSGESKITDGADPEYKNRNSREGKIAFRSVQSSRGISFERIN